MTSHLLHAQRAARALAAVAALSIVTLAPGVAHAADSYTGTPAPKVGQVDSGAVSGASRVRTESASPSAAAGSLPVTGSDLASLALLGFGAIGVGSVLVMKTRTSGKA